MNTSFRIRESLEVLFSKISDKALSLKKKIYITLIFLFSSAVVADYFFNYIFGGGPEGESYDLAINYRIKSPSPSNDIVILDIDERSLSLLSNDYGRWPWPREVHAEILASLESENPKSLIFNILITDPDKKNPEGDTILDEVTSTTEKTVYPITRLSSENDNKSQLLVSKIPGAKVNENFDDKTVAVLLPFLAGMQQNMGISNLSSDEGSLIRSYALNYAENEWSMKSLVGKAVELFDDKKDINEVIYLNWRNKRGDYKRISIGDYFLYLQGVNDDFDYSFENKHIIIGATAPGISSPKGTPISSYTDDNLILATALDDAINNTDIKLLPDWISVLITLLVIFTTGYLFIVESEMDPDKLFLVMEISAAALMYGVINFSNYFVDLSPVLAFGLAFYAVIKTIQITGRNSLFGSSNNFTTAIKSENISYCIIPFINDDFDKNIITNYILNLQKKFDVSNVFYCNEQFESDKLSENLNEYSSFIIFSKNKKEKLLKDIKEIIRDNNFKIVNVFDLDKTSNIERVKQEVAKNNLNQITQLF